MQRVRERKFEKYILLRSSREMRPRVIIRKQREMASIFIVVVLVVVVLSRIKRRRGYPPLFVVAYNKQRDTHRT